MKASGLSVWVSSFLIAGILSWPAVAIPAGKRGIAKKEHDAPIPLAWLTSDETAQFRAGRELFELPFSPRDGLGPFFNARSCEACHHIPSIGGSGPGYRGNIRYIVPSGPTTGVLFHDKAVDRGSAERLPENAILSKRRPSTLMGIGLVEAIPQAALLANADPEDQDHDGIRGRAAMHDGRLMRFGSQAHVATLFEFVADALRQELGLTSPLPEFTAETAPLEPPLFVRRHAPEPNVPLDVVNRILDFVSLLAPPPRDGTAVGDADVARGERLFAHIACAKCHVPAFRTSSTAIIRPARAAPMPVSLLAKEVRPYSDFLLHDMGASLNDGVSLGVAKPGEYRTAPLWGLRFRLNQLLHDSRGSNPEQAILYHGGEAARSRNAFLALPSEDRHAIIEFLKSL